MIPSMKYRTPAFVALFPWTGGFLGAGRRFSFLRRMHLIGGRPADYRLSAGQLFSVHAADLFGRRPADGLYRLAFGFHQPFTAAGYLQPVPRNQPVRIYSFRTRRTGTSRRTKSRPCTTESFLQEAQSMGFTGKLPDLSFSSLFLARYELHKIRHCHVFAVDGMKGMMGNIKTQMDQEEGQFRYQELHLGAGCPNG